MARVARSNPFDRGSSNSPIHPKNTATWPVLVSVILAIPLLSAGQDNPVISEDGPRTWTTARWTGAAWKIRPVITSDNNYDMGSLYIENDGTWRKVRQLTSNSRFNHTYVRHPLNARDGFYGFWADGHGRGPSSSSLYFCTKAGEVYRLPARMTEEFAEPEKVN